MSHQNKLLRILTNKLIQTLEIQDTNDFWGSVDSTVWSNEDRHSSDTTIVDL